MRKIVSILICCFIVVLANGQEIGMRDTTALTQAQRDSILLKIGSSVSDISNTQARVGRYKIYPTTNNYISLKLDTATGEVTAVQIGLKGSTEAMEYVVAEAIAPRDTIIGQYELYPTKNVYNFILLDTIRGYAFQVQWGVKATECGRWRIY